MSFPIRDLRGPGDIDAADPAPASPPAYREEEEVAFDRQRGLTPATSASTPANASHAAPQQNLAIRLLARVLGRAVQDADRPPRFTPSDRGTRGAIVNVLLGEQAHDVDTISQAFAMTKGNANKHLKAIADDPDFMQRLRNSGKSSRHFPGPIQKKLGKTPSSEAGPSGSR